MRVGGGREPTRWMKIQITEYYGQKYIKSRSWTVREVSWSLIVDKITRALGIRWHGEKPTADTVLNGQKQ